uniref:Uncharacterized protein n=2 Tax=Lotharella globosa TaxID=91324 RepID=A0A7S3YJP8_9EUKA
MLPFWEGEYEDSTGIYRVMKGQPLYVLPPHTDKHGFGSELVPEIFQEDEVDAVRVSVKSPHVDIRISASVWRGNVKLHKIAGNQGWIVHETNLPEPDTSQLEAGLRQKNVTTKQEQKDDPDCIALREAIMSPEGYPPAWQPDSDGRTNGMLGIPSLPTVKFKPGDNVIVLRDRRAQRGYPRKKWCPGEIHKRWKDRLGRTWAEVRFYDDLKKNYLEEDLLLLTAEVFDRVVNQGRGNLNDPDLLKTLWAEANPKKPYDVAMPWWGETLEKRAEISILGELGAFYSLPKKTASPESATVDPVFVTWATILDTNFKSYNKLLRCLQSGGREKDLDESTRTKREEMLDKAVERGEWPTSDPDEDDEDDTDELKEEETDLSFSSSDEKDEIIMDPNLDEERMELPDGKGGLNFPRQKCFGWVYVKGKGPNRVVVGNGG